MVGHQTIGPDMNVTTAAPFCHQVDVLSVVIITEECFLPAISPLGYMMGISRNYDSCYACHECIILSLTVLVNNLVLCPRNLHPISRIQVHFMTLSRNPSPACPFSRVSPSKCPQYRPFDTAWPWRLENRDPHNWPSPDH